MNFILGYLTGFLTATFILVVMTYFRRLIEHKVTIIEKQIEATGPKPRGFIVEPESDAEAFRSELIEKNRKAGRDTKIEDLQ